MKIYVLQHKEIIKRKNYINPAYENCEKSWRWKDLCLTADKNLLKSYENDKNYKIDEREITQERWEEMSEE